MEDARRNAQKCMIEQQLRAATQVQRNQRNASTNEMPPQSTSTSRRPDWEASDAPCRIVARRASLSAVRGNALIKGCTMAGQRSEEKKTPGKIHIGIITRMISPLTLSLFWARLAA